MSVFRIGYCIRYVYTLARIHQHDALARTIIGAHRLTIVRIADAFQRTGSQKLHHNDHQANACGVSPADATTSASAAAASANDDKHCGRISVFYVYMCVHKCTRPQN